MVLPFTRPPALSPFFPLALLEVVTSQLLLAGILATNAPTNPVYMATRQQPARRAKSRSDSGRQTKKIKIHSERPILSGSASSSSGLNMGDAHLWTHDEEIALFREAHVLLTTQQFSRKSQLNEELARVLNGCFPEVAIKFTSNAIKNKLTCNRAQIECSAIVARLFFSGTTSGSETTNSVAADSVTVNNGRIPTIQNVNNRRIPTIQECIILAESLEGLTPIEKADAPELMRLDLAAREAFMSFNDEQVRLLWIKKLIGPVNNPGTA
ncbi:hypothetical protein OsI_14298 [Oryza sativa Indica Group]|uniref:Uncharacterized protein n=1 Tax=Oryza sativa subsp. indica TaxID=39946 RepID=A2XNZ8_ORYSI|nr:hypothetical protein OsI_14298 [Oryza sativa Indica Group]